MNQVVNPLANNWGPCRAAPLSAPITMLQSLTCFLSYSAISLCHPDCRPSCSSWTVCSPWIFLPPPPNPVASGPPRLHGCIDLHLFLGCNCLDYVSICQFIIVSLSTIYIKIAFVTHSALFAFEPEVSTQVSKGCHTPSFQRQRFQAHAAIFH